MFHADRWFRAQRWILGCPALLLIAGVIGGCSLRSARPAASTGSDPYAGAAACAECHAAIFQRQASSHHAVTLRPADASWGAAHAAPDAWQRDRSTGLTYAVRRVGTDYREVVREGDSTIVSRRLDYLLGSGHHATSPMSRDGEQWYYLSLTQYAAHGWDFSPMHELGDPSDRRKHAGGSPVSPEELRKCFRCHTTRLQFQGAAIDATHSELGVRCEACHGPGRAHIDAVRAHRADPAIGTPRKWSATSAVALCEQCHNQSSTLDGVISGIPVDPASPAAVKYHVYGLQQSRCFRNSNGALRCTTCHDPHASVETSPQFYEAKCLECHSGERPGLARCPRNPRQGCLSCHMPKVRVERHTDFADHWIRARSPFLKAGYSNSTKQPAALHRTSG